MKRDSILEIVIGSATASAISAAIAIAALAGIEWKDILSALGALAGVGLGMFGAIWSADHISRRKRRDERNAIKAGLAALAASLVGWRDDLPRARGGRNDDPIEKMLGGLTLSRDYFARADQFASELTFLERAVLSPWPQACEELINKINTYKRSLHAFRTGQEKYMVCDDLHAELLRHIDHIVKTAKSDASDFLSGH